MKLLELSDVVYDELVDMASSSGIPIETIIHHGIGMGKMAMSAEQQGKYLGIATNPNVLENRFI